MGLLFDRANDALNTNPPAGNQNLSDHGSDWLSAVVVIFAVSFLVFYVLSYVARSGERVFHYIFAIALFVGAITYFAQASDLGSSVVPTSNNQLGNGMTRQIFWPKYVFWAVGSPAAIIALGLLSGISWATIIYQIFLAWIWDICYLVGAYTGTSHKWAFFAVGTIALFILSASVLLDGNRAARRVGAVTRDHTMLSGWLVFLWMMYPIAWGLSDGGNRITVNRGFVFFGILDLLMVPLLAFATLVLARKWDYGRLRLNFTQHGRVHADQGQFADKHVHSGGGVGAHASGVNNGSYAAPAA